MTPEKFSEKEMVDISDNLASEKTESKGLSRRKFTRNVLLGSAVLLTLNNQTAWGVPSNVTVSANLWASYTNNGYASFSQPHKDQITAFEECLENYNGKKPDFDVDPHICYPD